HGRPQVDGPDLGPAAGRMVRMASAAATGVEHPLALEEVRVVRGQIFQEVPLPFVPHLWESVPLKTEAPRGRDLSRVRTAVYAAPHHGLAHRRREHARDAVANRKNLVTPGAPERFPRIRCERPVPRLQPALAARTTEHVQKLSQVPVSRHLVHDLADNLTQ